MIAARSDALIADEDVDTIGVSGYRTNLNRSPPSQPADTTAATNAANRHALFRHPIIVAPSRHDIIAAALSI